MEYKINVLPLYMMSASSSYKFKKVLDIVYKKLADNFRDSLSNYEDKIEFIFKIVFNYLNKVVFYTSKSMKQNLWLYLQKI